MVEQTFKPSTGKAKQVDFSEFEASLIFIVDSRIEKPISKDPISKFRLNEQTKQPWS